MVTCGVEYTFLVDGVAIPDDFKIRAYYIVRLHDGTYRIFKKVKTETERAVLRYWKCEKREYVNLSWVPKGWSPSGGAIRDIAEGVTDSVVSGMRSDSCGYAEENAEDGQILYALPHDFDCLSSAEDNLRLIDGLLGKTGG
jgi:hypothetical protein